jgi:hypothetical protein
MQLQLDGANLGGRNMRRNVKILALLCSHVVLFLLSAAAFAGYRTQAQFQAAAKEPLFRVGAALTQLRTDERASASLDKELESLSGMVRAPSADVIRLAVLLELGRLDEARGACAALGWAHCDPQTLTAMRKLVGP